MELAQAVPVRGYKGATLVLGKTTKQQRLLSALCGYDMSKATAYEDVHVTPAESWQYVGSKRYNSNLVSALERFGLKESCVEIPGPLAPRTEKFLWAMDIVNDVFLRKEHHKGEPKDPCRRKKSVREHLVRYLRDHVRSKHPYRLEANKERIKHPNLLKYSPKCPKPVSLSSSSVKQGAPLMKWELDIASSEQNIDIQDIKSPTKLEEFQPKDVIENAELDAPLVIPEDKGAQVSLTGGSVLVDESALIGTWIWVDSVDHSENSEEQNAVPLEEIGFQTPSKDNVIKKSTEEITPSRMSAVVTISNDQGSLMATIRAASEDNRVVDELTLSSPLTPSRIPILLPPENVLKTTKENERYRKRKSSKKRAEGSSLAPLNLENVSSFYLVNASKDWTFE